MNGKQWVVALRLAGLAFVGVTLLLAAVDLVEPRTVKWAILGVLGIVAPEVIDRLPFGPTK